MVPLPMVLEAAVKNITDNLKVYPLAQKDNPSKMEFIKWIRETLNTIHDNDYHFYEHVNAVIQEEPLEMIDAETADFGFDRNSKRQGI